MMEMLAYLCTITSSSNDKMLTTNAHNVDSNYTTENLAEGWLRVDTWKSSILEIVSTDSLPSPEVFEINCDDGAEDILISEVKEEPNATKNEVHASILKGGRYESSYHGFITTPRVEVTPFPGRLSMDMFVDAVENFEQAASDLSEEEIDKKDMDSVGRRNSPLGVEVFESLFIGQYARRRWHVGDRGVCGNGRSDGKRGSRGRFEGDRRRWRWGW